MTLWNPQNPSGKMFEKKIILDTCALLWLVSGDNKLSENAKKTIKRASVAFVSAISAWEISLKYREKKLILPIPAEEWFLTAVEKHSLIIAPLSISVLCKANELPFYHRDPADRFIIATAILENTSVITADTKFTKYDIRVIS